MNLGRGEARGNWDEERTQRPDLALAPPKHREPTIMRSGVFVFVGLGDEGRGQEEELPTHSWELGRGEARGNWDEERLVGSWELG